MRWLPAHDGKWRAKSTDGYYAIDSAFEAFHIEALWASPQSIGASDSLASAQKLCDEHRAKNAAPTT